MNTTPLEDRLRRSLHTVAEALPEDAFAPAAPSRPVSTRGRGRRLAIGAGALAIPVALAAGAIVRTGPEYVDQIEPERIVMSGSVDGSRYLLVETERTNECDEPVRGVELVEDRENIIGSEWNTSGYEYGQWVERTCNGFSAYVVDPAPWLADPSRYEDSGSAVGDSFVWIYSVHPDVDTVRITSGDFAVDLDVYSVDGAGYAPFEIPKGMTEYTSELIIDGEVVPGATEHQTVPAR